MITAHTTLGDALLTAGQRLTEEHPDVPAGSVLRCYARAVRNARMWGCPAEHLAATAEASTRWMLAQRRAEAC